MQSCRWPHLWSSIHVQIACGNGSKNPRIILVLDRNSLALPESVEQCCYSGWGFERYTKGCWDASLDGFGLVNSKCFIQ